MPKAINGQMQINGITDGSIENIFSAVSRSLAYIGADPSDFALANSMFSRPKHSPMHGIGHIYRTMIGCALLGELLYKESKHLIPILESICRRTNTVNEDMSLSNFIKLLY